MRVIDRLLHPPPGPLDRPTTGRQAAAEDDTPTPDTGRPWLVLGGSIAYVAAATVAMLVRQTGPNASWETLWAEDGSVFLEDAYRAPLFETLLRGYEGYAHVLPRVIAAIAAAFPVQDAAAVTAVLAALTTALLSLYVFYASATTLVTPIRRAFLAATVIAVPLATFEVANSTANLQWYLLFALLVGLLDRDPTPARSAASAIVFVLAALSAPLSLLLAPLAAVVIWLRRGQWRGQVAPIAFLVGVLVQLGAVAVTESTSDPVLTLEPGYLMTGKVIGPLVLGEDVFRSAYDAAPGLTTWGPTVAYGALLAVVIVYQRSAERVITATFVGAAVALWVTPVVLRDLTLVARDFANLGGSRYAIAPMLCLVAAVLVPATGELRSRVLTEVRPALRWVAAGMAVLWLLVAVRTTFRQENQRALSPAWSDAVAGAEGECEATGEVVDVPQAPAPLWAIEIDCSRLR